jgi:hypothetical protein
MLTHSLDEVVETRTWRSGVEIVARINWSHIARVRRVLGVAGDEFKESGFSRAAQRTPLKLHKPESWKRAPIRAA